MKNPKVVWVTLVAAPDVPVWMLETDIPNVYKTDTVNCRENGVLMDSYEHVLDDPVAQKLFLYDFAEGRPVRSLGRYRDKLS